MPHHSVSNDQNVAYVYEKALTYVVWTMHNHVAMYLTEPEKQVLSYLHRIHLFRLLCISLFLYLILFKFYDYKF